MNVTVNIPSITINLISAEAQAGLAAIPALAAATQSIKEGMTTMANNQAEASAKLDALGGKLDKISGETTELVKQVRDLKEAAENAGNLSPEFMAKLDALAGQADAIDGMVDDVAPNPTPTPPEGGDTGNGGSSGGSGEPVIGPDGNPV